MDDQEAKFQVLHPMQAYKWYLQYILNYTTLSKTLFLVSGFLKDSRFSPAMWSCRTKNRNHLWIKSRIWATIDDWYVNNLPKNEAFAVFHSRVILPKFVSRIYHSLSELWWKRHLCALRKRNIIALEIRHIEIKHFL